MKRILATILTLVYLTTSIGATLHLHYCMGKLVSWGLLDHKDKHCPLCGMAPKKADKHCTTVNTGCCKDEHKLIKADKDQKITQSEFQLVKFYPEATPVNSLLLPDISASSFAIEHTTTNAPPRLGKVPVFLLNCNFRI